MSFGSSTHTTGGAGVRSRAATYLKSFAWRSLEIVFTLSIFLFFVICAIIIVPIGLMVIHDS